MIPRDLGKKFPLHEIVEYKRSHENGKTDFRVSLEKLAQFEYWMYQNLCETIKGERPPDYEDLDDKTTELWFNMGANNLNSILSMIGASDTLEIGTAEELALSKAARALHPEPAEDVLN